MNTPIKLPPLPYPQIPGNDFTASDMQAYAIAAIESDRKANNPESLTPAEAVFAFAGWLTSRKQSVTFGSTHEAAIAAELASEFTKSQGLQKFREDFHKHLMPYPSESAETLRKAWGNADTSAVSGDPWKAAIDHELVTIGSTADSFSSPKEALNALIEWHIAVATDPAVNGGYKLVPIEPTERMLEAGWMEDEVSLRKRYKAMLEAAPEPKDKL